MTFSRPLISSLSFLSLSVAFLLLLLVSVSLPILKPIYLLSITSTVKVQTPTTVATQLTFGVWGLCASSVLQFRTRVCYGPRLGYNIPPEISTLAGVSPALADAVEKTLRFILILHPVACGLSFIGFIGALFLGPHNVAIFTLIISIATGIVTAIVFAIDLALVLVAKRKITDLDEFHVQVDPGPGVWMILASLLATWIAVLVLSARACYCCGVNLPDHDIEDYTVPKQDN